MRSKMSKPNVPTASAIKPNTPMGATHITFSMHQTSASSNPFKPLIIFPRRGSESAAIPNPRNKPKTIICKILPSAKAAIGLAGIIPIIVSQKFSVGASPSGFTLFVAVSDAIVSLSIPSPGASTMPPAIAISTATTVVSIINAMEMPPITPAERELPSEAAPEIMDSATNGMTSILMS